LQIGEVATQLFAVMIQGDYFSQGGEAALKFPAYLAIFAEEENFHLARPA
jgi:hypothetical protein